MICPECSVNVQAEAMRAEILDLEQELHDLKEFGRALLDFVPEWERGDPRWDLFR